MNSLAELLANKTFWMVIGGYWIFMAFVGSMEAPLSSDPRWYRMLFRFCHILSGNVNRAAIALKVPGAEPEQPGKP
jgi:hypothetical protein